MENIYKNKVLLSAPSPRYHGAIIELFETTSELCEVDYPFRVRTIDSMSGALISSIRLCKDARSAYDFFNLVRV